MVTKTPDQTANKTDVDAHAVYSLFTYGTLNYDWSQEENGGEVLGGVFTGQDFTKDNTDLFPLILSSLRTGSLSFRALS